MNSLRTKIGLGYGIIIAISVTTTIIALILIGQLGDSVGKILRENYQSVIAAENMIKAVQLQENSQLSMIAGDYDLAMMMQKENRDNFLYWFGKAEEAAVLPGEPAILDSIMETYRWYLELSDTLEIMIGERRPQFQGRNYQFYVLRPVVAQVMLQIFNLLSVNHNAILKADEEAKKDSRNASYVILFASIFNSMLSIVAGSYFTRRLVEPITKLTSSVRYVANGRYNQKIDLRSNDEVGELSREFNKMTERLRAFEEMNIQKLVSEKSKSEAIVASISDPLIVTDGEGRIVLLNKAAESIFPFTSDGHFAGKTLREVVADPVLAERLESVVSPAGENSGKEEILPVQREGGMLYLRPRRLVISGSEGAVSGVVTLLQDVTRFKELDRMKSEFIASVSHEFRTPLTSINMTIDILAQNVLGTINDRQRELLDAAKSDTSRLNKLVAELLDLAKLESGRETLTISDIDLKYIVRDAVASLLLLLSERGIHLELEPMKDVPLLRGDAAKLARAVTNLVNNAIRYTPAGGKIHVRAEVRPDAVVVSVQDTGKGIPENVIESIFESFVQVKGQKESTPGSVGLGLAIARRIVEAHGGSIWVESVENEGSTFSFTIPRNV